MGLLSVLLKRVNPVLERCYRWGRLFNNVQETPPLVGKGDQILSFALSSLSSLGVVCAWAVGSGVVKGKLATKNAKEQLNSVEALGVTEIAVYAQKALSRAEASNRIGDYRSVAAWVYLYECHRRYAEADAAQGQMYTSNGTFDHAACLTAFYSSKITWKVAKRVRLFAAQTANALRSNSMLPSAVVACVDQLTEQHKMRLWNTVLDFVLW